MFFDYVLSIVVVMWVSNDLIEYFMYFGLSALNFDMLVVQLGVDLDWGCFRTGVLSLDAFHRGA